MRYLWLTLVATLAAACTDGGGGGGAVGTSHVLSIAFAATEPGCVTGVLADVDGTTPGNQYECSVSQFTAYGTANQQETILPQCNNPSDPSGSTNKPCWAIETDATSCTMVDHLRIAVESNDAPAADTHIVAQCASP